MSKYQIDCSKVYFAFRSTCLLPCGINLIYIKNKQHILEQAHYFSTLDTEK